VVAAAGREAAEDADALVADGDRVRDGDVDPAEHRERPDRHLTALEHRVRHVQVVPAEDRDRVGPPLDPPAALPLAAAEDREHGVEAARRVGRLLDRHRAVRRRADRRRLGRDHQILGDRLEFSQRLRLQRPVESLGVLVLGQPPGHQRVPQYVDHPVAIRVGGTQVGLRVRAVGQVLHKTERYSGRASGRTRITPGSIPHSPGPAA
jgi:hypothetical protein